MLRKLFNDEAGFVVSAELMIIVTLAFTAAVVGAAVVRDAVVSELEDVAESISSVNQSWNYRSLDVANGGDGVNGNSKDIEHSATAGGSFQDGTDDCDCAGVTYAAVCGKTGSTGTDGT